MPPLPLPNPFVSALTVGVVGTLSKAFLNLACRTNVTGAEHLYKAWEDARKCEKKGILTVANHISVMDDPLMWGILPLRSFFSNRTSRWTLGARDIMFTNPIYSAFFANGKVIDTIRGGGRFQDAVDTAIERLDAGDWVHIFPQGFVRQHTVNPPVDRLKWGIGRILDECHSVPIVIPTWIKGFEQIMPEDRGFPKFLPRLGANISVSFGDPERVTLSLEKQRSLHRELSRSHTTDTGDQHSELTLVIEQALNNLGNSIQNNKTT
ncbi:hypothetical protein FRC19_005728 [Serendipita sp. 401]|nr:hypothetical protein FRC19_005728 [Serendipita sp. 401]